MKLGGKVALITGGGTGIGTAIAERFVAEGAKICITGRRQAMLDKVAQALPSGSVTTCPGDVTKYDDVKRMVQTTLTFGGRLDVVVNNAGIDPGGTVSDLDPEVWRRVIDVNLTGSFLVMKASIPHLIKGGRGSIINISSLGGLRCLPGMPADCASMVPSRSGVTRSARVRLGPRCWRRHSVRLQSRSALTSTAYLSVSRRMCHFTGSRLQMRSQAFAPIWQAMIHRS